MFHPVGAHKTNDRRWVEGHMIPGPAWVKGHWQRRVLNIEKIGTTWLAGRWVERVLVIEKTALPRHCELALCQPRLSLPCDQQLLWQSWAELRPAPAH